MIGDNSTRIHTNVLILAPMVLGFATVAMLFDHTEIASGAAVAVYAAIKDFARKG